MLFTTPDRSDHKHSEIVRSGLRSLFVAALGSLSLRVKCIEPTGRLLLWDLVDVDKTYARF